jgi:hypothetical protein
MSSEDSAALLGGGGAAAEVDWEGGGGAAASAEGGGGGGDDEALGLFPLGPLSSVARIRTLKGERRAARGEEQRCSEEIFGKVQESSYDRASALT